MHAYALRILQQFDSNATRPGLGLDLDAVAVSLHCKHWERHERNQSTCPFAFNGFEDFNAFLYLVRSFAAQQPRGPVRLQFALRDYGAHYLAGDLEVVGDRARVFIMDSAPSNSSARKWAALIEEHFPGKNRVYDYPFGIQKDRDSCKVFTLDAVNHLANLPDLFADLEAHSAQSWKNLYHLAEHKLPPALMRNVQSLTQLKSYLDNNPEWAQLRFNKRKETLAESVARHTVTRTQPQGSKQFNEAILHKLQTFEHKATTFLQRRSGDAINQIVAVRNGLVLLQQLRREPGFELPNLCNVELVRNPDGTYSIQVPLPLRMLQSSFSGDHEQRTTVFCVKQNTTNAQTDATWLDVASHGVTFQWVRGDDSPQRLTGRLADLLALVRSAQSRVEQDPVGMLVAGCSQPLGTMMTLLAIEALLAAARTELTAAHQTFIQTYVAAVTKQRPLAGTEAQQAGEALAARYEEQLLRLTEAGVVQLANEAALRSLNHARKERTWTARVFQEGVTENSGSDTLTRRRARLETKQPTTKSGWTADGVFNRTGTKAKYGGFNTAR